MKKRMTEPDITLNIDWNSPERISLSHIAINSEIDFLEDLDAESHDEVTSLQKSIAIIGMLHPVYCVSLPDNTLSLISGTRRLIAAKNLGWEFIQAHVVSQTGLEKNQAFLFWLFDNLGHRTFYNLELVHIVHTLRKTGFSWKAIITEYAQVLGLPGKKQLLQNFARIVDLPACIRQSLVAGDLSLNQCGHVASLEIDTYSLAHEILIQTKLNNKETSHLFSMAREAAEMNDMNLVEFFNQTGIERILTDSNLNSREKGKKILQDVFEERYPELNRHSLNFETLLKSLKLPPQISIQPPRQFEGEQLKIVLKANSAQQLREAADKLDRILSSEELDILFNYL